jgi:hypothetical protein
MVVGNTRYQLQLSRLAYSFRGAIGMDYLQDQQYSRIQELTDHAAEIAEDLNSGQ